MTNSSQVGIYVVTHKTQIDESMLCPSYIPFGVGPLALGKASVPSGWVQDQGPFAEKNPYYCELTALHWIWENSGKDIKGLVHYRRALSNGQDAPLTEGEIREKLSSCDCLVSQREYLTTSIAEHYANCHNRDDLLLLRDSVAEEGLVYLDAFNRLMSCNYLHPYNILIARAEVFDSYCAWLFRVLERCEKKMDLFHGRSTYQQRVFGFLSERALNIWIAANEFIVQDLPVYIPQVDRDPSYTIVTEPLCQDYPSFELDAPVRGECFSLSFYTARFEELAGSSEKKALDHLFAKQVKYMGFSSPEFSLEAYLNHFPEERAVNGLNYPRYFEAYKKKCMDGIIAKPLPKGLVKGCTVFAGFDFSPVYDYAYYTSAYSDVPECFFNTELALRHFLTVGMDEGRIGSRAFDVEHYQAPAMMFAEQDATRHKYYAYLSQAQGSKRMYPKALRLAIKRINEIDRAQLFESAPCGYADGHVARFMEIGLSRTVGFADVAPRYSVAIWCAARQEDLRWVDLPGGCVQGDTLRLSVDEVLPEGTPACFVNVHLYEHREGAESRCLGGASLGVIRADRAVDFFSRDASFETASNGLRIVLSV